MKKSFFPAAMLSIVLFWPYLLGGQPLLKTPGEEVNYMAYSQSEEIAFFLNRIDRLADVIHIQIVGRTLASRRYAAKDIFLCIITEEGISNPARLNRNKPTFYIVAAKHGNEQSGKEAALRLIRDLAIGELKPLLKKVNFLILPQANPYGNWFDQRRNEQNLDLNRDQVKLESPESEVINRVFRTWMPEVTMDVHEKGNDFYRVNMGCVSNVNIHKDLQEFPCQTLFKEVEKALEKKHITFHEYLVTQRMGIDSSAGVTYKTEDEGSSQTMKRYSTTDLNDGRNSPGIYETLSFIQEGASLHDIKTLADRTRWQYFGLRFLAESIARHAEEIKNLVRKRRQELLTQAKTYSDSDLVHLRMKYARDENNPVLTIKAFVRTPSPVRGVLKSDKKAGDVLLSSDVAPYSFPMEYKVEKVVVKNWYPLVKPVVSVPRPLGYIIPAKYQDVIPTLLKHSIEVQVLTADSIVAVETYQIADIVPSKYDYLPPQSISVEKAPAKILVKKGDYYISCAQPAANLIPCLLEPQTQYGLIRYWKYRLVPDKGSLFPFLRVIQKPAFATVPYKRWPAALFD